MHASPSPIITPTPSPALDSCTASQLAQVAGLVDDAFLPLTMIGCLPSARVHRFDASAFSFSILSRRARYAFCLQAALQHFGVRPHAPNASKDTSHHLQLRIITSILAQKCYVLGRRPAVLSRIDPSSPQRRLRCGNYAPARQPQAHPKRPPNSQI